MRLQTKIAVILGALMLATAPAVALATQPTNPGKGNGPKYAPEKPGKETPGPGARLPEKAKAYGVYCQGQSKKHVAGQKGTEFSRCVTGMAKLAHDEMLTPKQACKAMSHKHEKGHKGTPFSRCVVGAAKLAKEARHS